MKFLTKYDYIQYKLCPRRFAYNWFTSSETKNVLNPIKDFLTKQGQEVGLLAQELFNGTDGIAFEMPISTSDLHTRPDVLNLVAHELIEIKSTTEIKDEHLLDVAFQKYVCDKAGVQIDQVKIGTLNKQYVLDGELNLHDLFCVTNVTEKIAPILLEIENDILKMEEIIKTNTLPDRIISRHCNIDSSCPYKNECWAEALDHTILDLRRDVSGKKFELHQSGIHFIKDTPNYVQLTKFQALQKDADTHHCAIIDHHAISEAMREIIYPLFFLDFESFIQALPPFQKTSPYEQIPFQASVHRKRGRNLKLKHFSFLHDDRSDPRPALAKFLIETLEEFGTIVAYHASFEKARIYELIKSAPQYEEKLLALIDRIWDLEEIFDKGMYIHPAFRGSTSIKKVLPVICPELSYDDLSINNGQLAFIQYLKMISPELPKEEKEKIKNDLEVYCKQDTYAMYAIYKKISELL